MQNKTQFLHLKPYAVSPNFTKGRTYKEKESNIRSPFQRDRDRIIHSSSFRRLKHKTQVFVNTDGDHYRTRLTHSMEVSQIARTLARSLGLNEDLCETLSLAHDLGHTPFGHAGEEVLDKCMNNYGGFDHNIQTFRILTLLENKYYKFLGLNLTFETLEGLIKHNGPFNNIKKYNNIINKKLFLEKINLKSFPSLEAQISSLSDDIAYNNHDLEDGLRANLFTIKELCSIDFLNQIIKKHIKNIKKFRREVIINQIIRELINFMVLDVIKNSKKNLLKVKPKCLNDIYKHNDIIIDFSSEMKKIIFEIKNFLKINMYNNKLVKQNTNKGKKVIKKLFIHIINNHKNYLDKINLNKDTKERRVCDFIAGMTDRFAINLYKDIL